MKTVGQSTPADRRVPIIRRLCDIERKPVRWLWRDRIARGKLTLLCGDPGAGKSTLTADMAARVSTGSPWPDGSPCERGGVILIGCEDDYADTVGPRLDKHGADDSRIVTLDGVRTHGADGREVTAGFTLADVPTLAAAIDATPDVRLIVIDPVSAYLSDADSHKNADIRGLLAPLQELAAARDVAIVLVTHLNKGEAARAMYRAMGSLAFIAAARAAFVVVPDAEDRTRRLLLPIKNNIGDARTGFAFRIIDGTVTWDREPIGTTADEALAAQDQPRRPGPTPEARDAAATWLRELLSHGPVEQRDVETAASGASHAWATVRRAYKAIGVISRRGGDGRYRWAIPPATGAVAHDGPGREHREQHEHPEHPVLDTQEDVQVAQDAQDVQDGRTYEQAA